MIDDSEIAKLEDKKAIVYITGFNAAYDDIYDYESHPNYQHTSDYNSENSYVFKPLPKPKDPHRDEIPFEISQVKETKENIQIIKSEQERQKYANDIMLAFITETENQNTIKIANTVQSLGQLANEIIETEPDIDILGNDVDNQIDENLVEIITKMEEIQTETDTLQDNLVQSNFTEDLSNISQILELEEISDI